MPIYESDTEAIQVAWSDLPIEELRALLPHSDEAAKELIRRLGNREARATLSKVERSVLRIGTSCTACQANSDPNRVPVHPGCNCDVMTDNVEPGLEIEELDHVVRKLDTLGGKLTLLGAAALPVAWAMIPHMSSAARLERSGLRYDDLNKWNQIAAVERETPPYIDYEGLKLVTPTSSADEAKVVMEGNLPDERSGYMMMFIDEVTDWDRVTEEDESDTVLMVIQEVVPPGPDYMFHDGQFDIPARKGEGRVKVYVLPATATYQDLAEVYRMLKRPRAA